MHAPDERFSWAVATMNIQPTDHILEIGFGHGIAVSLIAPLLTTGSVTAVDRSAAMISKASAKNAGNRAVFLQSGFAEASLPRKRYDRIFAFNVNFFIKNPAKEIEKVRSLLGPEGRLYVFYQSTPGAGTATMQGLAAKISRQLEQAGLSMQDVLYQQASGCACIGIIAHTP